VEIFECNITELLAIKYTLGLLPSFIEMHLKTTKLCYFNEDNPDFSLNTFKNKLKTFLFDADAH